MDRLTAMQVFVQVADRGSLTAAAAALDMSRAMASRYLESLEQWLDARLMHRTTRRISLTDAGEEALSRCRQLVDLADDTRATLGARNAQPTGRLRITTSVSFAQAWLAGAVAAFVERHPATQIELLTLDRAVNLVEERVDLAVRITNRLDDTYVARRLTVCRSVLCATAAYLARHGEPVEPEHLKAHRCITHAYGLRGEYRLRQGEQTHTIPVSGPILCSETSVVRQAVLADAGIAMLPTYLVGDDLIAGRLVALLPTFEPETLGVHAIYMTRQHQPRLLRALLDFLAERLGDGAPPWDRAWGWGSHTEAPARDPTSTRRPAGRRTGVGRAPAPRRTGR